MYTPAYGFSYTYPGPEISNQIRFYSDLQVNLVHLTPLKIVSFNEAL